MRGFTLLYKLSCRIFWKISYECFLIFCLYFLLIDERTDEYFLRAGDCKVNIDFCYFVKVEYLFYTYPNKLIYSKI